MWVPATITYQGRAWTKVGVRFKGNSSLRSAWGGNTDKLPFKLDFDQFEKEYPEIKDQRFFGFKQLALSTNFGDASNMRDAIAYEVLAEAGHVASKTTHYEVFLDHGAGASSLGVYSSIEVTDDTVIKRHFGSAKGNIYEGDGPAMSLAAGLRDRIPASFPKENNEDSGWSDVEQLYDALHAPTRKTDPAAWRTGLEAIFDTETYLEWLAIAAVLQHWDTYGGMSHNIYLYNDPASGKLTWISWDHNLILGAGGPGGGMPGGPAPVGPDGQPLPMPSGMGFPFPGPDGQLPPPPDGMPPADGVPPPDGVPPADGPGRGGMGRGASLDKQDVPASWPLIRFLMDDPVYRARYVKALEEAVRGPLEPSRIKARVDRYAAYLGPFAARRTEDRDAYAVSLERLRSAIDDRAEAVNAFLANPTQSPSPTPRAD